MKNIPILISSSLVWLMITTMEGHALLFQGPSEPNPPYPYVQSQPIDILPQGFVTINVGDETYYYCNGVFYQRISLEQKYVVVPPPIGAVVFTIPQGYQLILIDGVSYYEYQGIYYKRTLDGYRVIYPPV